MTLPDTITDRTLMVMDDDGPLRTRLGRALENRGFEVVMAAGVQEALKIARTSPPAFAVLDMRLEDGSGLTVVESCSQATAISPPLWLL
jgi:two-component system, response regulator RegA